MEYIRKDKHNNRFKLLEGISDFSIADFVKYDLYQVTSVDETEFKEILRTKEIQDLKARLVALGEDVEAPTKPLVESAVATDKKSTDSTVVSKSYADMDSKVISKATGKLFTMEELTENFEKFRENIEKDIAEVVYSACDENGFVIHVTEIRKDLPKVFPNGIPLRQVID